MSNQLKKILFVCLGNICRSPLAEGVFRALVKERKLDAQFLIDSCGTGHWHEGEPPHRGSVSIAEKHGISITDLCARQIKKSDYSKFDLLIAMDRSNFNDLCSLFSGDPENKIVLLRDYDPEAGSKKKDLDVPDPFYDGGFEGVYDIINRASVVLLERILDGAFD